MAVTVRSRRELRNRAMLALWLAVPFIALMLLVSPRGDFPLNDDWVYAKMVQALANHGHFGLSPLSNASALTQTLYAAPLVKLFGFSFTLLRLTTIFMGWVTVCFTAFTARALGLSNRGAVLAALTVFANPIFINLTYTFMTDVPFCAFASIAMYSFVKALRRPAAADLILGSLFSIAAFYDRQLGALLPVSFLFAGALSFRKKLQRLLNWRLAIVVASWLIALALLPLAAVNENEKLAATAGPHAAGSGSPVFAGQLVATVAAYVGLFLLPIAAGIVTSSGNSFGIRPQYRWIRTGLIFFAILFAGNLAWAMFPWMPNIIRDFGVGPAPFSFLRTRWEMGIYFAPVQIGHAWYPIAILAIAAFAVCADAVIRRFQRKTAGPIRTRRAQSCFLLILGVLVLAAPCALPGPKYFDRYILPAVPPLAVLGAFCFGYRSQVWQTRAASVCVAMLFTWSVIGLQDYMAWNTARWRAIDILRTRYHAPDNEINGGFEFNGMYTSDEYLRRIREEPDTFARKTFWVVGDTYLVSPVDLTKQHGYYELLDSVPYYSWLGFDTRRMYLFRIRGTGP